MQIKVKDKSVRKMLRDLEIRAKDTRPFFILLATKLKNMVLTMFQSGGGKYGRASWPPISPSLYIPVQQSRPGTDGSTTRKFTSASKPLQASGGYRMSFKTQAITSKGLVFGSRLTSPEDKDLAYNIQFAGGKQRLVMPVWGDSETQSEVSSVFKTFAKWITGGRK